MIDERPIKALAGGLVLLAILCSLALGAALFAVGVKLGHGLVIASSVLWEVATLILIFGLFVVNPNEARVLQLFGRYVGTVQQQGLRWANPLYTKRRISVRVRNFETERSKVNDTDGNPIEIASVVVWKVVDTAQASFEVDSYVDFVHVQSEAAVRNLATQYPYDTQQEGQLSLRGHAEEIASQLKSEIQGRLHTAGVEVLEARITHLAYAPEIASAMLQRQQAGAVIAARGQIVEGAVSMVQMALKQLASQDIVDLDEERKAAMVSNLLVVLCGDKGTQPVLNTGTLYQ